VNIIDALNSSVEFEIKTSKIYKRLLSFQKDDHEHQREWKEIIGQKEKLIQLLKNAVQGMQCHGPNSSLIQHISSKDMQEGLDWINKAEKEFNLEGPNPSRIVKLIHPIASFELRLIYSPLIKVYSLLFIKKGPQLNSLLQQHLHSLNVYLKKHHAPSLTSLIKNYPFLTKRENERKGFREDELYQNLVKQQKPVTLRLKNGGFFSGRLDGFDHFSLKCSPLSAESKHISALFLKESIISVQIDE